MYTSPLFHFRLIEEHGAELNELKERYQDLQNELRDKEEEVKVQFPLIFH